MSLKAKLAGWVVACVIVLTAVAGVTLYLLAHDYMIGQFDQSLVRKVRLLSSTIKVEFESLELEFEDLNMSEFASAATGGYLQVWFDGQSLHRSPSLAGQDMPVARLSRDPSFVQWMDLPGGARGRGITYRFAPASSGLRGDPPSAPGPRTPAGDPPPVEVTLCLARDVREVSEALTALQIGLVVVGLAQAVLLSLVISWGVSRGMRPVDVLAAQVSRLDDDSMDQRIDVPGLPRELEPIVEQFHGLMQRLGVAFERERSFSADVAHELRTPLAGLRTTIDVALSRPRNPDESAACLRKLLHVTMEMQEMVESLLHLASIERGRVAAALDTLQLDQEIEAAWKVATRDVPLAARFDVIRSLQATCPIATDPSLLAVVLRNVLHNAVTYVDDGGAIAISTEARNGDVEIRVANSGSLVPSADAERVFNRFWRGDKSRTRTGRHSGLGLALAQVAVHALGGRIKAESQEGGQFIITVQLPAHGNGYA